MKRRQAALILVGVFVTSALAGNAWLPGQPQKPRVDEELLPAVLKVKPLVAQGGDDQIRKLRIARYNAAISKARTRFAPEGLPLIYSVGVTDQAVLRLFEAELALADNADKRMKACENCLEAAKYLEEFVGKSVASGAKNTSTADLDACRYLRITAEIRLLDEKAGRKTP